MNHEHLRPKGPSRFQFVDWLRGLAVVFMIQTHVLNAWTRVEEQTGGPWRYVKVSGGAPAAMFMFLSGVSLSLAFGSAARAGLSRKAAILRGLWRAGRLLVIAFAIRLLFHVLGGGADARVILRVDILNCMAVALAIATVAAPPVPGRLWNGAAIVGAVAIAVTAPWIAAAWPARWGEVPPTSYVWGDKPQVMFPLVPWAAFTFAGLAAGTAWSAAARDPARMARVMTVTALAGALLVVVGIGARYSPFTIYETVELSRTSPSFFSLRVGILLLLSAGAWVAHRRARAGSWSPIRQLGLTSLLVYWVHLELCYGRLARPLRGHLDLRQAFVGFVGMTIAMLLLSIARTRITGWIAARREPKTASPA